MSRPGFPRGQATPGCWQVWRVPACGGDCQDTLREHRVDPDGEFPAPDINSAWPRGPAQPEEGWPWLQEPRALPQTQAPQEGGTCPQAWDRGSCDPAGLCAKATSSWAPRSVSLWGARPTCDWGSWPPARAEAPWPWHSLEQSGTALQRHDASRCLTPPAHHTRCQAHTQVHTRTAHKTRCTRACSVHTQSTHYTPRTPARMHTHVDTITVSLCSCTHRSVPMCTHAHTYCTVPHAPKCGALMQCTRARTGTPFTPTCAHMHTTPTRCTRPPGA